MSTNANSPFRPDFVEVELGPSSQQGTCPWCKAVVHVDPVRTSHVCAGCDSRFSTSAALGKDPPAAPPAPPLPPHPAPPLPSPQEALERVEAAIDRAPQRELARRQDPVDVAIKVGAGVSVVFLMLGANGVGGALLLLTVVLGGAGVWFGRSEQRR